MISQADFVDLSNKENNLTHIYFSSPIRYLTTGHRSQMLVFFKVSLKIRAISTLFLTSKNRFFIKKKRLSNATQSSRWQSIVISGNVIIVHYWRLLNKLADGSATPEAGPCDAARRPESDAFRNVIRASISGHSTITCYRYHPPPLSTTWIFH